MSENRVWILVEGIFDRSFYGQLCENNKALKNEAYKITLAKELPGFKGNGKENLLNLYRYLRKNKVLLSQQEGKKTIIMIILDKDIDDLERCRARSPHVVYTKYHTVENYAFRFGDLCLALASSASLDIRNVIKRLGEDPIAWTQKAAQNWRAWVEYCILVKFLRINNVRNYGLKTSLIHASPYSQCNEAKRKVLINKVKKASGLTESQFKIVFDRVSRCVDRIYQHGKHDIIFKGEWYGKFLKEDAKIVAGSRQYSGRNLETRLLSCLLMSLDFCGSWAAHFHKSIEEVIKML